MKRFTNTLLIIPTVALLMILTSCAVQSSYMASSKIGFTRELDEPSSRGQLQRISPEQSFVAYRFALSPDDNYVVFSGVQTGGGDNLLQLWKISSDGSGSPVKLTSGGSSNYNYPSFTNNGEYIVYESAGQLWRVRSDGAGGKMRIPGSGSGNDSAPHVSINNDVVFCSTQITGTSYQHLIWISNLNGGDLTQIREGSNPRWSPDGRMLTFEHAGDIWTVKATGTDLSQLTNTSNIQEVLPSFSQDGKSIVYASNEGKAGIVVRDWNIWSMSIDGSNKTQVTELASWDCWPLWGRKGIYFLSGRAQKQNEQIQRIWLLKM